MPTATDDFILIVVASVAADIRIPTIYNGIYGAGSGESFRIDFQYKGGINPVATKFSVNWYASTTHRNQQNEDSATPGPNALAGVNAPGAITFEPTRPVESYNWTSGALSGNAPRLPQGTSVKSLFARLAIEQAALNAPAG